MNGISTYIKNSNKILVYGIGYYYSLLALYVEMIGKKDSIVALSAHEINEPREIDGYPAYPLDRCKCEDYNAVIIAISPDKSIGVAEELARRGFSNIYQIDKNDRDTFINYFASMPIQKNKVLFDCYSGMGYRCNCKYVAEYIRKHDIPIEMVWKTKDNNDGSVPGGIRCVRNNSKDYFRELYTSAILISNVCFSRVRPEQYVIWMWHGTGPFKKAGAAAFELTEEKEKELREAFSGVDLYVSNSHDNTKMFREDFFHEGEIGEWGSPRNDILFYPETTRDKMREQFGIQKNQKVILYVPTFREDIESSISSYDLDFEAIRCALSERFDGEFVLMYRLHHWVLDKIKSSGLSLNGIDVSDYDDTQELLILADVLITDYSSVMWDFSIMKKPIFLYHNDVKKYVEDRGFYWPPEEWPYPKGHTQEEMLNIIESFDQDDYLCELDKFFQKDPSYDDGHASERVVKRIIEVIDL